MTDDERVNWFRIPPPHAPVVLLPEATEPETEGHRADRDVRMRCCIWLDGFGAHIAALLAVREPSTCRAGRRWWPFRPSSVMNRADELIGFSKRIEVLASRSLPVRRRLVGGGLSAHLPCPEKRIGEPSQFAAAKFFGLLPAFGSIAGNRSFDGGLLVRNQFLQGEPAALRASMFVWSFRFIA